MRMDALHGFGVHIPKGYIYAAMAFSVFVELINLWIRRRRSAARAAPVKLHERYAEARRRGSRNDRGAALGPLPDRP